jgi:hypothetical protein
MKKSGYILTGGGMMNIGGYHLQDTFVKLKVSNYSDGHRLHMSVKDASGFEQVYNYLKRKKVNFEISRFESTIYDVEYFPIRFEIGGTISWRDIESVFNEWAEKIHDEKTMYRI